MTCLVGLKKHNNRHSMQQLKEHQQRSTQARSALTSAAQRAQEDMQERQGQAALLLMLLMGMGMARKVRVGAGARWSLFNPGNPAQFRTTGRSAHVLARAHAHTHTHTHTTLTHILTLHTLYTHCHSRGLLLPAHSCRPCNWQQPFPVRDRGAAPCLSLHGLAIASKSWPEIFVAAAAAAATPLEHEGPGKPTAAGDR